MTSYRYSSRTIFVLGVPRSGTSWLAKIFDAHPDVLYRHEPDILNRNLNIPFMCSAEQVKQHSRAAEDWLNELAAIRRLKTVGTSPVFVKSFHTALRSAERRAAIATLKMAQSLPFLGDFANAVTVPDFVDLASNAYKKLVIKSVSGMGRAGLFAAAAPDSRIVVIIRHPCGQVESMLRGVHWALFEHDVPIIALAKTEQARQHNLTADKLAKASFAEQLAWSWVIQNEAAFAALRGAQHVKIVRYIDLAGRPEATAKELFEFCDLDWRPEVAKFLVSSTQGTGYEHYYQIRRNPLEAANKWRQQLSQTEIEEIKGVVVQSEVGQMFMNTEGPAAINIS